MDYPQKDIVWRPRVAGATYSTSYDSDYTGSDFGATMYQSYDDTGFSDVLRVDMIEFEGDALYESPYETEYGPYESRGFIEKTARESLPNDVTDEFEDDESGAPYPTQ